MKKKFIAILAFMQSINPLTSVDKSTGKEVGKMPRKSNPKATTRGFFELNPKPFDIAEIKLLVTDFKPTWIVRLSETSVRDGKVFPPMLWVGQDFPQDTVDDLFDYASAID